MTRSNRKKTFPFFIWHRRLGLIALIFVLVLAITGIMLNHTESLEMDETRIDSDILLNWYGLNPHGELISFATGENIISQWDGQIFFNSKTLAGSKDKLLGVTTSNEIIAIALTKSILLVDSSGEIIEHINFPLEFQPLTKIGLNNNAITIQTEGLKIFSADQDILNWNPTIAHATPWSTSIKISPIQQQELRKSFRGNGLSLERVILDLHSGRILNASWGIYIMDASAIIIILLSLSGFWVWWSRKQKIKTKS